MNLNYNPWKIKFSSSSSSSSSLSVLFGVLSVAVFVIRERFVKTNKNKTKKDLR